MAEYHAIIGLLTQASSLGISRIIVYLDSQLVVYQLNCIYTIRNHILLRLHLQVRRLERMFDYIEYRHIPRELNSVLDSLANYIMDRYLAHIQDLRKAKLYITCKLKHITDIIMYKSFGTVKTQNCIYIYIYIT
jgi:ribonuclease HI